MTKKAFGKAQRVIVAEPVPTPSPVVRPSVADQRRSKRTRTLLAGKLCDGMGLSTDCTISDLSDTGARVRADTAAIVPADIFLVHLREQKAFEATVVWRRANGYLGLKFKAVHDLHNPATE